MGSGQFGMIPTRSRGAPIRLGGFVRFQFGEGIEKQQSDFAAEVAAAAGTSKAEPVA
jgi:elongation factor Ts